MGLNKVIEMLQEESKDDNDREEWIDKIDNEDMTDEREDKRNLLWG